METLEEFLNSYPSVKGRAKPMTEREKAIATYAYSMGVERGEDWRLIATAPKAEGEDRAIEILVCRAVDADGRPILMPEFGIFCQVAAWWSGEGEAGGDWVVYCDKISEPRLHFEPTHWKPLPPPPFSAPPEKPTKEVR